jgi:hypothetical protein
MTALRAFVLRHFLLAMMLVGAALCLRMVMPAGFMVAPDAKVLTISICVDSLDHDAIAQIAIPMKGTAGKSGGSGSSAGKGDCAFSSLSMASTAGADAALLALALAFIIALGFAPTPAPRPRRLARLRPPLRGPPLSI